MLFLFLNQGCAIAQVSAAAFAVLFSVGTIAAVVRYVGVTGRKTCQIALIVIVKNLFFPLVRCF